jgi:OmpA-OmpF porin, OOP family
LVNNNKLIKEIMSVNLLDALKGYITPELISQASGILGESEGGISKAVSATLPTLLSGLVNKSSDSTVMGSVMDMVTSGASGSDGILGNLSGLLSGNSATSSVTTSLLSMLFGNKVSGITDMIAGASGVKSTSVTSLLGMVAPMLLGYLGKSGTSLSGLTSMLSSQKDSILAAAPSGLSSMINSTVNAKSAVSHATSHTSSNNSGGGLPKWLLPLLLIVGAAVTLWYFTRNKTVDVPAVDTTVVDSLAVDVDAAVDSAAVTITDAVEDATTALGSFFKFKLPNGVELNAPQKGIENQVVTWMNDKDKVVDKTTWFNFDRLLFETGKSTLKPESEEQLKNMSEIMKAYPTMEVKLGGYTDNTGNAASNVKLSGDRAKSVMAELVKMGIAANRIAAEGYGDQFPVATNDTEEGRAQNRRIAIRVTKK